MTFRTCTNADDQYVMYCVNVTNEEVLWKKMNVILFIIMSIGAVVAIFVSSLLSSRIVKPINLLCDFSEESCLLRCDEKAIYKAFSNIINNGLRYLIGFIKVKKENMV